MNILAARLHSQGLIDSTFASPEAVVGYLGAVQAQDYPAAKWAVGMRLNKTFEASDIDLDAAYNEGRILRTHVLRPTWHFVLPEDIRWMVALTGPAVQRVMGTYHRKWGVTDAIKRQSREIIVRELQGGKALTRQDLKEALQKNGMDVEGERPMHILMDAELEGLICSGPRQGKQFTYMMMDDRAPTAGSLPSREEMIANLVRRYLQGHGPAQVQDFAWWAGMTKKDATIGFESIKSDLIVETRDDKTYWFFPPAPDAQADITSTAFLLSIYDEYTIGFSDRSDLGNERERELLIQMGNGLTAVLILGGRVVGTWKRRQSTKAMTVTVTLFRKLTVAEQHAVQDAAERYAAFFGLPVILETAAVI